MAYLGCHLYNENTEDIIKPATDVFEINDFTAASDWENFIDDIENILRNWRICEANTSIKVTDSFLYRRLQYCFLRNSIGMIS